MESTSLIRKILFNILVILTILFIYYMFFPKKSYVDDKLNKVTNPIVENTINDNMNNMEIASKKYLLESKDDTVTLQHLIDKKLLSKDDYKNCDMESYAKKENNKINIYLKCNGKDLTKEIKLEEEPIKEICIYQYEKKEATGYTEWSEWSKEEVKQSDLIEVETKVENEIDGVESKDGVREVSIKATANTRNSCPEGYKEENNKCVKKEYLNTITASISYTCPNGYGRNGFTCYKNGYTVKAQKGYYCPTNTGNLEYVINGSNCDVYNIINKSYLGTKTYFTCPEGYELRGEECFKNVYYEEEVENYKEVTYYRYRTRNKNNEKNIIKWSKVNDYNLINDEYNMTEEIFCGF